MREITYIPGEENEPCDRLSRRGVDSALSISDEAAAMGMPGVRVLDMNGDKSVMGIIGLCDPKTVLKTAQEFFDF